MIHAGLASVSMALLCFTTTFGSRSRYSTWIRMLSASVWAAPACASSLWSFSTSRSREDLRAASSWAERWRAAARSPV